MEKFLRPERLGLDSKSANAEKDFLNLRKHFKTLWKRSERQTKTQTAIQC